MLASGGSHVLEGGSSVLGQTAAKRPGSFLGPPKNVLRNPHRAYVLGASFVFSEHFRVLRTCRGWPTGAPGRS
eukprot:9430073-Pyramimonas_sp.AAC.1